MIFGSPFGKKQPPLTLERKLEQLAQFGFHLAAPFQLEDLLASWPRGKFEKPGYNTVLVGLGMTEERPPWRNHCENVWHFDTECIEDHGAYVRIAKRMRILAQGSLPIDNIRDSVDVEAAVAWLEFEIGGVSRHIDCRVQDDWVDSSVFGHFVEALAQSDPTKIFLYYDLGGQDCIIACATKEAYQQLRREGFAFEPLSGTRLG